MRRLGKSPAVPGTRPARGGAWRIAVLRSCALLLALAVAACAPAYDCKFTQVAQMPLAVQDRLLVVPAGIDGKRVNLVVDTGAERTTISDTAAKRLGLVRDPRFMTRSTGVGGTTLGADVKVDQFVLGGTRFPITRIAHAPVDIRSPHGLEADGLLGADILLAFDMDIDIPGHRLTLYRRRICPAPRPPWPGAAMEVPGVTVRRDRLVIPVTLDGAPGSAVLDTGAQVSVISLPFARRLGLTDTAMAGDPTVRQRGIGPNIVSVRLHQFGQLRVGPVTITAPAMPVLPAAAGFGDMLIGEDFLQDRRVWLSFNPPLVFVSPGP